MNEFDEKAYGWDENPMHRDRSIAIANGIKNKIHFTADMTALEFGAGTGITSFLLKDHLKEITMMDSSIEMVKVIKRKIESADAKNMKAVFFNLEKDEWTGEKFDLVIAQMVLHHISDIKNIIRKFYMMLNPGGYVAIADLYPEDGSFHGPGFAGHKGFDTGMLSSLILQNGFKNVTSEKCFVINKNTSEIETGQFDVFLLTAKK